MKQILTLIFVLFLTFQCFAQENDYQKNLKLATDLFLAKSDLPDSVLLQLVPKNMDEFIQLYYDATKPETEIRKAGFFYKVTQDIFDKVIKEKEDQFYLPSLQLASFADGEFAETFVPNLEAIIKLDESKFCKAVVNMENVNRNPLKYFCDKYCK